MEPFLFNVAPQRSEAPKISASQKKAAPEAVDTRAEKSFTNHLEKAVKDQQQDNPKSSVTTEDTETTNKDGISEKEPHHAQNINEASDSLSPENSKSAKILAQFSAQNSVTTLEKTAILQQAVSNSAPNSANLLTQAKESPIITAQQLAGTSETFGATELAAKDNKAQTSILGAQIQKILDGINTPQQIVIRGNQINTDPTQQPVTTEIAQNNLSTNVQQSSMAAATQTVTNALINSNEIGSLRSSQKNDLGSHRQDTSEQFIAAKANRNIVTGVNSNANNPSTNQGQNEQLLSQQNPNVPLTQTTISDNPLPFSQVIVPSLNAPLSSSSLNLNGLPQTTLPSGHVVYEEQVMQQIQHQFNINASKAQSNINIRLHPAELGELKINLMIKEGTVRVNVVAQSHQTQDILERNMLKLKTILEDQGLFVDDISISQASQTDQDFNLFDEQFAGNPDYYPKDHQQNKSFSDFDLHLAERAVEDTFGSAPQTASSINLSI